VKAHFSAMLPAAGPLGDVSNDGVTNDVDLLLVWQNLLKPVAHGTFL